MKKHGALVISKLNLTGQLVQDNLDLVKKYGTDFISALDRTNLLTQGSLALVKRHGTDFISTLDKKNLLTQDSLALVERHGTDFISDLDKTDLLVQSNLDKLANCESLVFIHKLRAVNLLTQTNLGKVTRFKNTDFVQHFAIKLSDLSPTHPMRLLLSCYSYLTQNSLDRVVEYNDPSFVNDLAKNSLMAFFPEVINCKKPYFVHYLAAAGLLNEHTLQKVLWHKNTVLFCEAIERLAGSAYLTQTNFDRMVAHENPSIFANTLLAEATATEDCLSSISTLTQEAAAHQEASALVNGPNFFNQQQTAALTRTDDCSSAFSSPGFK